MAVQAGRGCRPKGCVCGVSGGIKIALIEFENAFGWIIGGDGGRLEDFVVERDREFLLLNPGWIVISRRLPVIPVRASASRPSASVSGSAFNSMRTMMKPPTSLKFSNWAGSIMGRLGGFAHGQAFDEVRLLGRVH